MSAIRLLLVFFCISYIYGIGIYDGNPYTHTTRKQELWFWMCIAVIFECVR